MIYTIIIHEIKAKAKFYFPKNKKKCTLQKQDAFYGRKNYTLSLTLAALPKRLRR